MGHHRVLSTTVVALGVAGVGCFGQFGDYTQTGSGGSGAGAVVSVGGSGGGVGLSASSTGGGGSFPCAEGPEDCTNDCDDDRDGVTDCADLDDCQSFRCVAAPATGWLGPVVIASTSSTATCPTGTVPVQGAGTVITMPGTATCNCDPGPATGGVCTTASLTHYTDMMCALGPVPLTSSTQACTMHTPFTYDSVQATSVPTGSICPGTPSLNVVAQPTTETRLVCAVPTGGGCPPSEVCAPFHDEVGFDPRACVYQAGGEPCPSPYDMLAFVAGGGGVDDQRSCPDCGYSVVGATCNGSVELFFNDNCTGANTGEGPTLNAPCLAGTPNQAKSSRVLLNGTTPITQGNCVAPSASPVPVGKLGVVDPMSVCCAAVR